MYVVIKDGAVFYAGSDAVVAAEIFLQFNSKVSTAKMITISSLKELDGLLANTPEDSRPEDSKTWFYDIDATKHFIEDSKDQLSRAASRIFKILDESGTNDETVITEKLKSRGEKAIAQVRSLGVQGMKTVGEGFVALGDLLRKTGEKPESED